jgi:hypothetical protein
MADRASRVALHDMIADAALTLETIPDLPQSRTAQRREMNAWERSRMKTQRLTVAEIQIYFDAGGAALFSAREKQRAAVELDLCEYRGFIDRWLEASEETRPRVLTEDELQLRSALKRAARVFKRSFDKNLIDEILRYAVERLREAASLTTAQLEEAIAEAISSP